MNTKKLYRLYNIESDTVIVSETDYSFLDHYITLSELYIDYHDNLLPHEMAKLEDALESSKKKLLAKAQLMQEKLDTLRCIDYAPGKNANEEGFSE